MPICNKCGARGVKPEDMLLTREEDGRWSTRCRQCPGASGIPWPLSGGLHWLAEQPQDLQPEFARTLDGLRKALGLPQHERVPDYQNHHREYERHEVALTVHFRRQNEPETLTGAVHDLSKGGLCFSTTIGLKPAEIIDVSITTPDQEHLGMKFSSQVEVVRCNTEPDAHFKIGGRFLGTQGKDHRKAPRYHLLLTVWYQRKGREETREGAVLDISRSGVGFVVKEDIPVGEVLAVCIRGDSGAFHKQDLRGLVRVARIKPIYEGNYEIGTEYIKTRVIPRAGGQE